MPAATADWLHTDYYRVLGVPETATSKEITRAYHALARELHPDAGPRGADEERFKQVSAAYEVLGDADRRREYDAVRAAAADRAGNGQRRAGGGPGAFRVRVNRASDPFDGFAVVDPFGSGATHPRAQRTRRPRRGQPLRARITLPFEQAVLGGTVELPVAEDVVCPACAGSGVAPHPAASVCPRCGGRGAERTTRTVRARLPAGVDDGQTVRIPGHGGQGTDGGPAGDLLVVVRVSPHPLFGRHGHDLTVTVPVTFAEAALGADIDVPTLDGAVTVRLPPGTASGTTLRVPRRGVRVGDEVGDLLVTVEVEVPRHLTDAQRAAVQQLAAATPGSPRDDLLNLTARAR